MARGDTTRARATTLGLARRTWARFRNPSLGTKLVAFSTLLAAAVVWAAFVFLSIEIRRHTKSLLADTVAHHQRMVLSLQHRGLEELVRTSSLMTDSPTLRAAMETYQTESTSGSMAREDLLATIQTEVDKVAAGVGRDLLVVTDRDGDVLAASGRSPGRPAVGARLGGHDNIRRAIDQDAPVGPANFAVLDLGDEHYQAGTVPILLQGFVIGTLTLGDRIDQQLVEHLHRSFDSDFVVAVDGKVLGSTLGPEDGGIDLASSLRSVPDEAPAESVATSPVVVPIGSEQYVAATLAIGSDTGGRKVTLYLLHSLTRALDRSNRFLLTLFLSCGLVAVVIAGVAAWWMSRSVLRPLESFVAFVRSVARSGDHARRFAVPAGSIEIATLNDAFDHLMDSLLAHEERLRRTATEELDRVTRLKESEKLAALGRMLSGAAHEINNPLTGVVGNIELLLRGEGLDPDVRDRLERVSREGARVVALVRRLLRVSHRDTGQKSRVDLRQVLRESVDVRRHDFVSAGIGLELDLAPEPLFVRASPLELQQVFLNIINNAFDALGEGVVSPRLTIRTTESLGSFRVVFADNGPGIQRPEQVFDPFYTTKEVGKGTGLGLSICYAIVQDHGGRIVAANGKERGAEFLVEIPRAVEAESELPASPAATSPADDGPSRLEASVLIVDDEPTIVELQKEILEALGAAVVGVGSGSEAIAALQARPFDLIVTDLKMPGNVSGQDLYQWVASNLPEARRTFIFVTGDTAGELNKDFIETAGARCLLKPFSMAEYVRTLRETFHETRTQP